MVMTFQHMRGAVVGQAVMAVKTCVPSGSVGLVDHDRHVEQRHEALPHEYLFFLAADENCDLARALERLLGGPGAAAPSAWRGRQTAKA